jgi:hypothetical protein
LNARVKEGGRREDRETAGGHHGIAAMRTEEGTGGGGRSWHAGPAWQPL